MSPERPNAHLRPHNLAHTRPHSRLRTQKKASLSRPTRSRPCLIQSRARPTSSSRLHHFFPPIRPDPAISPPLLKYTHIRATLAHARDRPRGPETLPPTDKPPGIRRGVQTGEAPAIRRGVPCGRPALWQWRCGRPVAVKTRLSDPAPFPCPPVLICHAA